MSDSRQNKLESDDSELNLDLLLKNLAAENVIEKPLMSTEEVSLLGSILAESSEPAALPRQTQTEDDEFNLNLDRLLKEISSNGLPTASEGINLLGFILDDPSEFKDTLELNQTSEALKNKRKREEDGIQVEKKPKLDQQNQPIENKIPASKIIITQMLVQRVTRIPIERTVVFTYDIEKKLFTCPKKNPEVESRFIGQTIQTFNRILSNIDSYPIDSGYIDFYCFSSKEYDYIAAKVTKGFTLALQQDVPISLSKNFKIHFDFTPIITAKPELNSEIDDKHAAQNFYTAFTLFNPHSQMNIQNEHQELTNKSPTNR